MMSSSRYVPLAFPALVLATAVASAQSIPADTGTPAPGVGFSLPSVGGSLNYGLNVSELISNGFYNDSGVDLSTNFSGDLAYISKSASHPFSAVYAGGVLVANSGQPTTFYQNLAFSQVLSTKRWNIVLADSVSYLPESPAVGLSGVPGVGDLGIDPVAVAGVSPGLGILTTYGPRVSNTTSGTVSRTLTGRLSLNLTGNYDIQRFIGDNASQGINTTVEGGSAGLSYRLSARDSLSGNYNYSRFNFSGSPYSFSAQGGTLSYSRQWSARLTTSVSGGPQVTSSNYAANTIPGGTGIAISSPALSGSFTTFAGGASASYITRMIAYSLSYNRGTNNGSGVIPGGISDNLSLTAHRQFGRTWSTSGMVSYSRSRVLPIFDVYAFSSDSLAFSAQATRGLGRYFATYGSYTLEDQSTSGTGIGYATPNAFSGVYQVFALGITYSPRNILLSR